MSYWLSHLILILSLLLKLLLLGLISRNLGIRIYYFVFALLSKWKYLFFFNIHKATCRQRVLSTSLFVLTVSEVFLKSDYCKSEKFFYNHRVLNFPKFSFSLIHFNILSFLIQNKSLIYYYLIENALDIYFTKIITGVTVYTFW